MLWPSVWYCGCCFWGKCVEQGINLLCYCSRYLGPAKTSVAEGALCCGSLSSSPNPQFLSIPMYPIFPELRKTCAGVEGRPLVCGFANLRALILHANTHRPSPHESQGRMKRSQAPQRESCCTQLHNPNKGVQPRALLHADLEWGKFCAHGPCSGQGWVGM